MNKTKTKGNNFKVETIELKQKWKKSERIIANKIAVIMHYKSETNKKYTKWVSRWRKT